MINFKFIATGIRSGREFIRRIAILFCVLILLVCIILSCKSKVDKDTKHTIEFYNAVEKNSDEYMVSSEPLFTDDNIDYYDWSTHTIVFKEGYIDKYKELNSNNEDKSTNSNSGTGVTLIFHESISNTMDNNRIGGSKIFDTGSRDKFIVYIDNELIYDGYYNQSIYSSFLPIGAVMIDRSDGVRITLNPVGVEDNRNDIRIYNALESLKILKN
ncbi:hypothetical protein [Vallitalea okinawensis]|uniref:hypothetical protein n=1 Tax=Vallitalea okinawensis TaxID=2078660 RepID=UPI000CFD4833|nr:hypothetical protein [Vallitalea okinawensis]